MRRRYRRSRILLLDAVFTALYIWQVSSQRETSAERNKFSCKVCLHVLLDFPQLPEYLLPAGSPAHLLPGGGGRHLLPHLPPHLHRGRHGGQQDLLLARPGPGETAGPGQDLPEPPVSSRPPSPRLDVVWFSQRSAHGLAAGLPYQVISERNFQFSVQCLFWSVESAVLSLECLVWSIESVVLSLEC